MPAKLPARAEPERYSADEVVALLDVPAWCVERWCKGGLIPGARWVRGAWSIPARGLALFLRRTVEPLYSPEQVAGLLSVTVPTVREYLAAGRLKSVKLGTAKGSPVRVPESELRRWIAA